MATINEIWVVEPLEGKTRREQKQRLAEWRDLQLAEGVKHVDIWEGGYGDFSGAWVFCMIHESAEAFGKMLDRYAVSPENFDNATEAWKKNPVLKFRSGGMVMLTEDLA